MRLFSPFTHTLSTLLLGVSLLLPGVLWAEVKPATIKGAWQVGMVRNPKQEFNYCLMRGKYDNDLTLSIALSSRQEINIGVDLPGADLKRDDKYEMLVTIDNIYQKGAAALAGEKELIITPMGPDEKLMAALKKGKVLTLTGREDRARFALKGTSQGLKELKTCVDVGTGKIKEPPQSAEKVKPGEFPAGLKQLLENAKLKNLEIVPVKDLQKSPVDFAWRTENIVGGMRERKVPADTTIEKMSDLVEKGYKDQCNGIFTPSFGAIEELPGIKLRTVGISCQMAGRNAYISLLIYLTDTNLFTLFMHESDMDSKAKADGARDSIAALIRNLAREQADKEQADKKPAPAGKQ